MRWLYRIVLYVLWPLLAPLNFLILPLVSASWRQRREFERRNRQDPHSVPWSNQLGEQAHVLFEVSSEGELEQVRPLLLEMLQAGLRLELAFCSPSVEKACGQLASAYPRQLRILRLPLVTYFPGHRWSLMKWATAKRLILCRYDFFPELMLYGLRPEVDFQLLSATLKNRPEVLQNHKGRGLRFAFWKGLYSSFDFIVTASEKDLLHFHRNLQIPRGKLLCFDFRLIQIQRRMERREEALRSLGPFYREWRKYLESFPRNKRVIFGSFWSNEARAFANPDLRHRLAAGEVQVTVFPHSLKPENLQEICASVGQATSGQLPLHVFTQEDLVRGEQAVLEFFQGVRERPGPLILNLRGILCESYSFFHHAFVGGGHGRSIHSVLEPYLAMAHIYVGPKVFRSTEFDFVQDMSPGHIHIVEDLEQFANLVTENEQILIDEERRVQISLKAGPIFKQFMERTFRGLHVAKSPL